MRGQIMIEYLIFVSVGMLLVGIVAGVMINETSRSSDRRHDTATYEQFSNLRTELLAAHLALDGYRTQVEWQPPYRGVDMNVTILDGGLRVESERAAHIGTVPGVNGSLQLSEGTITINKENGTVSVT